MKLIRAIIDFFAGLFRAQPELALETAIPASGAPSGPAAAPVRVPVPTPAPPAEVIAAAPVPTDGAPARRRRDDQPEPPPADGAELTVYLVERIDALLSRATAENDRQLLVMLRGLVVDRDLDLPRFPAVGEELLRLDADSPQGGRRIAQLVAQDLDITGRVMQLAGSAVYGRPVRSLEHAVSRLGVEVVRQVAVGVSIQGVVYRVPGYDVETTEARERAFRTGMAASRLAVKQRRGNDAGEAFLAGLFHEVGLPLIYRLLSRLRARTRGGRPSPLLVQRITRELAGPLGLYYLSERRLSDGVLQAVRFHAGPHHAHAYGADDSAWLAWTLWAIRTMERAADKAESEAPDAIERLQEVWPNPAPDFNLVAGIITGLRTAYSGRERPALSV